jgi:creatinine amidohydrolase
MSFKLAELAWPAIRRLQKEGHELLVLPCGATEQHGPHLPVNTDTLIADALCQAACEEARVPVLPALSYTVSVGHTSKWPGTFSLTHETFVSTLCELADWSERTGWKRLLVVNAHCGNDAPLRVAVDKIRTRRLGKLQVGWVHSFALTPEIHRYHLEDAADYHANKAETDLMLHLAPSLVDLGRVEDDPDRTMDCVFSYPVAQTSANGLTGTPSRGNAEEGALWFERMKAALVERLQRAKTEAPPLPEACWTDLHG